jgi:hypothetical protein
MGLNDSLVLAVAHELQHLLMTSQAKQNLQYEKDSILPVTTLHEVGGVLGRPVHTFFWALTNSWSRLWLIELEVALEQDN